MRTFLATLLTAAALTAQAPLYNNNAAPSLGIGADADACGFASVATGPGAKVDCGMNSSVVSGANSHATGTQAVCTGPNTTCSQRAIAQGYNVYAVAPPMDNGGGPICQGHYMECEAKGSIGIGSENYIHEESGLGYFGARPTTIGAGNDIMGKGSSAIGSGMSVPADDTMCIGTSAGGPMVCDTPQTLEFGWLAFKPSMRLGAGNTGKLWLASLTPSMGVATDAFGQLVSIPAAPVPSGLTRVLNVKAAGGNNPANCTITVVQGSITASTCP